MELTLVINSGSSSHKCSLFEGNQQSPLWNAHLTWKEGFRDAHLITSSEIDEEIEIASARDGLEKLLETLPHNHVTADGHRVVHGGEVFSAATPITPEVKKQIEALSYLAPLHNPANLEGIAVAETRFPHAPQFAVFDTAFHATLSDSAATYPLPLEWRERGVRRYGFHGISHAYCSKRAQAHLPACNKMVVCHLGAGASLCAVKGGKSCDTTMGMTPLEGLMMASRSGSVDPEVVLHLITHEKLSPQEVDSLLNKRSGLLGVSGLSEDMRDILAACEEGNRAAQLAFNLFIHRLRGYIGMMIASLKGLDALIFTGGIGENTPLVREKTCDAFPFLGLKLDQKKNRSPSQDEREISASDSKITVWVIPTQEEWEIATQIHNQLS